MRQTATASGAALNAANTWKMTEAVEACRSEVLVFVSMPWKTLGGWHEETVEQIKKLASAQDRQARDMSNTIRKLSCLPGAMQPCSSKVKHHNQVQTMTGCCNVTFTNKLELPAVQCLSVRHIGP